MAKARSVFVVALRLLATAVSFSAAMIMARSHETVTVFGITIDAKYQYTPSFKFLAIVNGAVSGYSLLVLLVPPTSTLVLRVLLNIDVLVAMLLTASLSAAGSISYVGKNGNDHAGWMPVCDQIPKFCNQAMGSIICNFLGVLFYIQISLYNIHIALRDLLIFASN